MSFGAAGDVYTLLCIHGHSEARSTRLWRISTNESRIVSSSATCSNTTIIITTASQSRRITCGVFAWSGWLAGSFAAVYVLASSARILCIGNLFLCCSRLLQGAHRKREDSSPNVFVTFPRFCSVSHVLKRFPCFCDVPQVLWPSHMFVTLGRFCDVSHILRRFHDL